MTPKGGTRPASQSGARRPMRPDRIGPFERPDRAKPLGQVGRRPSSPTRLFTLAAMYFVCGVGSFFLLKGSLRIIVGVVLIGLSLLWLRGASTSLLRQQRERSE